MAVNARSASRRLLVLFALIGLPFLLVLFLLWWRRPQQVIRRKLKKLGYSDEVIKYWTCVSAFETAQWTSKVYKDSNNLFAIIVPKSNRLDYGEGQTIFPNIGASVDGLIDRVIKPFKYPEYYASIDDLVKTMKKNGYFGGDVNVYINGVKSYYKKLYG